MNADTIQLRIEIDRERDGRWIAGIIARLTATGRKNTPTFAGAISPGASMFTSGSTACTSTSGSRTTGSAPW
jgi:hypothetical protein